MSGQAARLSRRAPTRRSVPGRCSRRPSCRAALQPARFPMARSIRRGPGGAAKPRLSQAVGSAHAARPRPQPGERCLDLGASRRLDLGARLGARHRVDKAPLDPEIAAMPGVDPRRERLRARARRCRPGRLAVLRRRLLSGAAARGWSALDRGGLRRNFVCTVKFQGATDLARRPRSPPSPARGFCTCTTTSTSSHSPCLHRS